MTSRLTDRVGALNSRSSSWTVTSQKLLQTASSSTVGELRSYNLHAHKERLKPKGTLLQHAEEATGSMRQEIRIVGTELTLAGDGGSRGINLCPRACTGSQWDQELTTTIRDFAFCPWPPPVRPKGHQGLTSSGRLTMAGKQLLGSDSYTRLFLLSSISPGYSADYGQPNNFPLGKIKRNEKLQAAGMDKLLDVSISSHDCLAFPSQCLWEVRASCHENFCLERHCLVWSS